MKKEIPHRQGVYALILNKKMDSLLMVKKVNSGVWDFPGGGVDEGETHEQALLRELNEELGTEKTGSTILEILHRGSQNYKYDWPKKEIQKNIIKTGKEYKGQEQTFFLLTTKSQKPSFVIQQEEISEYKWIPLVELESYMIYPELLNYILNVLKEYGI